MKKNISLIIFGLLIISACNIDALLFGTSAPKDFCHPNPCKNNAHCKVDEKNNMKGTCTCIGHYYGPVCEETCGCFSNPCKNHATCKVDLRYPKIPIWFFI